MIAKATGFLRVTASQRYTHFDAWVKDTGLAPDVLSERDREEMKHPVDDSMLVTMAALAALPHPKSLPPLISRSEPAIDSAPNPPRRLHCDVITLWVGDVLTDALPMFVMKDVDLALGREGDGLTEVDREWTSLDGFSRRARIFARSSDLASSCTPPTVTNALR